MLTTGEGAKEQEPPKEYGRQNMRDTVRIATATNAVTPKPAPAIKTTITRLYSMSLPVCSVWSQKSKVSAMWAQRQIKRSRDETS